MLRAVGLCRQAKREHRVLRGKLRDLSLSAGVHQQHRTIEEVRRRRAIQDDAERIGCDFRVACHRVRSFNDSGFDSFRVVPDPKGRPSILPAERLRSLVDVALSGPPERCLPFTVWLPSWLSTTE
jgi:hypothetical protein